MSKKVEKVIEWIEALAAFDYAQKQGSFCSVVFNHTADELLDGEGFSNQSMCCIAVAWHMDGENPDLYESEVDIVGEMDVWNPDFMFCEATDLLGDHSDEFDDSSYSDYYPLQGVDGVQTWLIDMNDKKKFTHPEIAKAILSNVDYVFNEEAADEIKDYFWGDAV